nr:DUF349 domain-containing protein [Phycicoccus jejuensis]
MAANRSWSDAAQEFRSLRDEWKAAGTADRSTESALWPRFRAAQDAHFAARSAAWHQNQAAKASLVREAEHLAASSDTRSAGERMRALGEEWKRIGPCDKADSDRLWAAFNAARTKLRTRRDAEFEERKRQWAANKSKKESLVRQMNMLRHSSDFRAAKEQARSLTDQWKASGPCDRADNDRLWNDFSASKTRVFEAARVAGEQRKAEAARRAWNKVQRLEEQLRSIESRIYQTQANYSRALSARSPSMRNPNWHTIVANQQRRQSDIAARLSSLHEKRSDVQRRLIEARSRANSF